MNNLTVDELSTNVQTQKHIDTVRAMLERFSGDLRVRVIQCKRNNDLSRTLLVRLASELCVRGIKHDSSKLEYPEVNVFTEYTKKLAGLTYGSQEYKDCLAGMKPALDHHYANNPHHPEGHSDGIDGMNIIDILEMFADWYCATKRHNDGDINKSIEINTDRFNLSPELVQIFKNTVPFLEACEKLDSGELIEDKRHKPDPFDNTEEMDVLDMSETFVFWFLTTKFNDEGQINTDLLELPPQLERIFKNSIPFFSNAVAMETHE